MEEDESGSRMSLEIDRRKLRRERELMLAESDHFGFRLLEFGAETKHSVIKVIDDFVECITTNPLHWPSVKSQLRRFEEAIRRIGYYFAFGSDGKPRNEGISTITKVEFLESELERLKKEMKKLKELSDCDFVREDDKHSEISTKSGGGTETHCGPENSTEDCQPDDQLNDLLKNIPYPPAIKDEPLYKKLQVKAPKFKKQPFSRKLPPTSSLADAIRLGAAVKLRKVEGLRSPGGTPIRKKNKKIFSKNSNSSPLDMIQRALHDKFKNANSPPLSPIAKPDSIDDPEHVYPQPSSSFDLLCESRQDPRQPILKISLNGARTLTAQEETSPEVVFPDTSRASERPEMQVMTTMKNVEPMEEEECMEDDMGDLSSESFLNAIKKVKLKSTKRNQSALAV